MRTLKLQVPRDAAKKTIEAWLLRGAPGMTDTRAAALLGQGAVRVNGKVARIGRKLWGGEEVSVELPAPAPFPYVDRDGPKLTILHADASVVIVDKPTGVVSDAKSGRPSIQGLLAAQVPDFDVEGLAAPGIVHRLDRETTGCLAFARTDDALGRLNASFDEKEIEKSYLAVVLGSPPDHDKLDTPYARHPEDSRRFTTKAPSPRRARLSYRTIERFVGFALVDISLETGRTHQIRVQLADVGHAVLGDTLYGPVETRNNPLAVTLGRHALHAARLQLPSPLTGDRLRVEAPVPADLQRLLAELRRPKESP